MSLEGLVVEDYNSEHKVSGVPHAWGVAECGNVLLLLDLLGL